MFEGFERKTIKTSGADILCVVGGSGPPALLLHGYPQTHVMWHSVAPELARSFTVVVTDLRGYGDSSKPEGGPGHAGYSKRAMAQDQIEVMASLGFERFVVLGHDRGARVGHRMALDAPDKVIKLAVLDIVPTYQVFEAIDKKMATAYYHWFFLIQPYDLPERLIGGDPIYYLHRMLGGLGTGLDIMSPQALAEYERCFRNPDVIHATCEDYRAAASIDLVHDEADRGRNKVECPVLVLWGAKGYLDRAYDVLEVWKDYAREVRGRALPCGHFLVEECPEETTTELLAFLQS
jgi:haloacetate dehalogenase